MKAVFNLWKHRYLRTVGSLLIAVVLIAGVVSCTTPANKYDLTMAVNPAGGGTAIDETGTSPYAAGTLVDIKAVPADCYRFVNWTAPAGTFGDPNAATTTFTMPAQDVAVTANFELVPPDHFKFYNVSEATAPYIGTDVKLVDQFGTFNAKVGSAVSFGNPAEKIHNDVVTPISDPDRHYTLYLLDYGEEPQLDSWQVLVNNQFGSEQELTVTGPIALAVPTQKEGHEEPVCLNHFLVYQVVAQPFEPVNVELKDQFTEGAVTVHEPVLFANPVQKTVGSEVTEIEKEDEHWVLYGISGEPFDPRIVEINNQFGAQSLELLSLDVLAVPSQKISWEQPLDHFKCYYTEGVRIGEEVELQDQFLTINATLGMPDMFANPVDKVHGEVLTPISNWDNHLTFYILEYEAPAPPVWYVTVSNQFGVNQELWVTGPTFLAVPTRKGDQDPPVGLDHFLVYTVLDYTLVPGVEVFLRDQFNERQSTVLQPLLFANPVRKTHGTVVTPIQNPDDHLLFYVITTGSLLLPGLPIDNQFGAQSLTVYEGYADYLGVPSDKIEWSPVVP